MKYPILFGTWTDISSVSFDYAFLCWGDQKEFYYVEDNVTGMEEECPGQTREWLRNGCLCRADHHHRIIEKMEFHMLLIGGNDSEGWEHKLPKWHQKMVTTELEKQ